LSAFIESLPKEEGELVRKDALMKGLGVTTKREATRLMQYFVLVRGGGGGC
jgi:hypothetical protein